MGLDGSTITQYEQVTNVELEVLEVCKEEKDAVDFSVNTAFGGNVAVFITCNFQVRWQSMSPCKESVSMGVFDVATGHMVSSVGNECVCKTFIKGFLFKNA